MKYILGYVLDAEEYAFFMQFIPFVYRKTLTAHNYLDRLIKRGSASQMELRALSTMLDESDIYDDLNTMMNILGSDGHRKFFVNYGGPDECIKSICKTYKVNPYEEEDN